MASSPETGDELSFGVNGDGSVEFSRNGQVIDKTKTKYFRLRLYDELSSEIHP